ncbi:hypothetical protein KFE18_11195 [Clostridiaceae bacterium Marseille-Q4143]|nr:hypothetical protein KFE18_11195 [Clostridiaceae bacterium Marseille-Q4143]
MKEADAKHDHAGGAARATKTAQHYADSKKELLIPHLFCNNSFFFC